MLLCGNQEQYGATVYMQALNDGNNKFPYSIGWAVVLSTINNTKSIDTFQIPKHNRAVVKLIRRIITEYSALTPYNNYDLVGGIHLKVKLLSPYIFKLGSTQTTGLKYKKFG